MSSCLLPFLMACPETSAESHVNVFGRGSRFSGTLLLA